MPDGLDLHSDWRLCPSKKRVCSSGISPRGWYMNWPKKHSVPTGLSMVETQLDGRAVVCLFSPQEQHNRGRGYCCLKQRNHLGRIKTWWWWEGKGLALKNLEKPWWFSKPLMFDLSQILKRILEKPLHQQVLWFSLLGEKSSESTMGAHFQKNKGSLLEG